jgi:hypothetical protein
MRAWNHVPSAVRTSRVDRHQRLEHGLRLGDEILTLESST